MPPSGDVAVVIPARNESGRIAATVAGAAGLPGVDLLIVVDDGSADDTAALASQAGATVLRHDRNRGKAAAMETGAEAIRLLEATGAPLGAHRARHLLFLDADLGETAAEAGPLTEPVRAGAADMTIAVFTPRVRQGGHGLVLGLSGAGIERATGWRPAQPLAAGFGVETALTIDLVRAGMRVTEVEVPLAHRATGNDWASQVHRARQFADVARALAAREAAARAIPIRPGRLRRP